MFKLTIAFASLVELHAFVQKMGAQVVGGSISHDQPIGYDGLTPPPTPVQTFNAGPTPSVAQVLPGNFPGQQAPQAQPPLTPAQKTAATKAAKKLAAEQAAQNAPQPEVTMPSGAFPGAAPVTNFGPGNLGMGAPAQQTYQQPVTQLQPQALMASTPVVQAFNVAPPVQQVQVSPERQQYNDECGKLVNALGQTGFPETQLAQVLMNSFTEAGCPAGSRISTITDAQIQVFYPILHRNVTQVFASMQQQG